MQDQWFRWEREASIHLLYPTLEGSMEPLKGYIGFGFPTTILIFKNSVVTWCMRETEFYDFGKKLREIYTSRPKEERLVEDLKSAARKLQRVEKKIERIKLSKLDKEAILDLYDQLHNTFLVFYAIGAISTPLSFETEYYLKQNANLTDEEFNLLTAPKKDSYSKESEKYLLKTKDIEGFARKYYWIDNNYSRARVLNKKDIKNRLLKLKDGKRVSKRTTKVKLSTKDARLIELLRNYAFYKDNRKKHILIYLHFLEVLLKEISRRTKLSMDVLRSIFPWEVEKALNGDLDQKTIQKRKNFCAIVWKENHHQPKVYTDDEAKVWESKTLPRVSSNPGIIIGRPASPGKVRGKVQILLSASECSKFAKGRVLVTFMTSPDFMPAIKKATAIITNLGGVTSHASVISRELGIPCIVGTKIAAQVLKDGDLVEVDADKGVVSILS